MTWLMGEACLTPLVKAFHHVAPESRTATKVYASPLTSRNFRLKNSILLRPIGRRSVTLHQHEQPILIRL
ncbi:hypothetical protein IF2G_03822 [Cordyceps javanica]|nr:hypothetical protein IF2G_03822 [Cordyceps javanica]